MDFTLKVRRWDRDMIYPATHNCFPVSTWFIPLLTIVFLSPYPNIGYNLSYPLYPCPSHPIPVPLARWRHSGSNIFGLSRSPTILVGSIFLLIRFMLLFIRLEVEFIFASMRGEEYVDGSACTPFTKNGPHMSVYSLL